MPMGQYKDFAACIAAQKQKGHSDESAHKICGAIKQKTEGQITDEELNQIKMEAWIFDSIKNKKND